MCRIPSRQRQQHATHAPCWSHARWRQCGQWRVWAGFAPQNVQESSEVVCLNAHNSLWYYNAVFSLLLFSAFRIESLIALYMQWAAFGHQWFRQFAKHPTNHSLCQHFDVDSTPPPAAVRTECDWSHDMTFIDCHRYELQFPATPLYTPFTGAWFDGIKAIGHNMTMVSFQEIRHKLLGIITTVPTQCAPGVAVAAERVIQPACDTPGAHLRGLLQKCQSVEIYASSHIFVSLQIINW